MGWLRTFDACTKNVYLLRLFYYKKNVSLKLSVFLDYRCQLRYLRPFFVIFFFVFMGKKVQASMKIL